MSGDDLGRLIYLGLLASVIAGYFFVSNRHQLGKVAQQGLIWGLIFLGAVAGYGLWNDVKRDVTGRELVLSQGRIVLPMAPDGHFYVTAEVNGARIRFVVDTGASDIVMTRDDARRAGIDLTRLSYFGTAQTANGTVRTAPVTLDRLDLAEFRDAGVPAVVNEGDLETSLLGMSYLSRFGRIEMSRERLILER